MVKIILIVAISFISFSGISQSWEAPQSYIDSLNSVRIVSMKPNPEYLEFLNKIYFPSVAEYNLDNNVMDNLELVLESRYGCKIYFSPEYITDEIENLQFEVFPNNVEIGDFILVLNLSVLEELYQEGELNNQLNEYYKWADLINNYVKIPTH
jgi:hypothetical protein